MLSVFSGSIFVLPYLFAVMFGKDMVLGVVLYIVMAALYVGAIFLLGRSGDGVSEEVKDYDADKVPLYIYGGAGIQIIRCIIRLMFYIVLAVAILGEGQVPFVERASGNSFNNLMVLLPLLLVAYYGANTDIEKYGRISEMIFWAAFFPYVLMMIFGLSEMDFRVFVPGGGGDTMLILKCYALLTFIVPAEIYPQLKMNTDKKLKASTWPGYLAVMSMIILVGVLSLFMAGIYGLNGMTGEPMTSVAIMRYIELPLGVLQRFDVLMVWFFMTGVFALMSGTLFYIRKQLCKIVSEKMGEILLLVITLATIIMCLRLPRYEMTLGIFVVYGAIVDIPLSLLSAAIGRAEKRSRG